MSDRIKYVILIMFLTLLPLSCASTYILGSHQVSFNVSEPYSSSAKIDPPTYMSSSDCWIYDLNMTIDTQHSIFIRVNELSSPDYGFKWIKNWVELRAQDVKDEGIGGYKFSSMDFRGYPAYQGSNPAQIVAINGESIPRLEKHELAYQIDERTIVLVYVLGTGMPYQEIFDTIEVTEAPTKPTKYAPYINQ